MTLPPDDPRLAQLLERGSRAARSLSDVLWEAMQQGPPDPQLTLDLSERLSQVAGAMTSLARTQAGGDERSSPASAEGEPTDSLAPSPSPSPSASQRTPARPTPPRPSPPASLTAERAAQLVDVAEDSQRWPSGVVEPAGGEVAATDSGTDRASPPGQAFAPAGARADAGERSPASPASRTRADAGSTDESSASWPPVRSRRIERAHRHEPAPEDTEAILIDELAAEGPTAVGAQAHSGQSSPPTSPSSSGVSAAFSSPAQQPSDSSPVGRSSPRGPGFTDGAPGSGSPASASSRWSVGVSPPSTSAGESEGPAAEPPSVEPGDALAQAPSARPRAIGQERIEIRDERREGPSRALADAAPARPPWIASIERRLERYERDRLAFAVLLVELSGIERLRHAELPGEVARLTGLVEAALSEGLRPADSLMRESPGRYWLLAPETDTAGAKTLAARLARGVRQTTHRGAPLQLAVGLAVCPQDGRQARALAAQADIALYAAQASGRAVAPPDEPA